MANSIFGEFKHEVRRRVKPIRGANDLEPLVDELGGARIVMLGEASHGTHEFYDWRRRISERLIVEHGFDFIAVEGDWPSCWALNEFVRGERTGRARGTLRAFARWPTWMWANADVVELAEWMRARNQTFSRTRPVGFFGLDVYSLFESIDAVLRQLQRIDPELASRTRLRYACFDPYLNDERAYTKSLVEFPAGCEAEALATLQDLLRVRLRAIRGKDEALFDAVQNARVVADAERYYRAIIHADEDSWNVRDRHMIETLDALLKHHGEGSKAIVWAHNTHVGDYRATDMLARGQVNIGGLAREKWGEENVALLGFGTYRGTVTASGAWDGPTETMRMNDGRADSVEGALHTVSAEVGARSFFFSLRDDAAREGALGEVLGHRAIGVVYRPEYEHFGNYVPTALARRYDAFLFVDETTALSPLVQPFDRRDIPETFPVGE